MASPAQIQFLFLDTEFTQLLRGELLSMGLVSLAGDELYLELDLTTAAGHERSLACNDFVRSQVLPQFGQAPTAVGIELVLAARLPDWLSLQVASEAPCYVGYDWSVDFDLLERLLGLGGHWGTWKHRLQPVNLGILQGDQVASATLERMQPVLAARGLKPHHALADALILAELYRAQTGCAP